MSDESEKKEEDVNLKKIAVYGGLIVFVIFGTMMALDCAFSPNEPRSRRVRVTASKEVEEAPKKQNSEEDAAKQQEAIRKRSQGLWYGVNLDAPAHGKLWIMLSHVVKKECKLPDYITRSDLIDKVTKRMGSHFAEVKVTSKFNNRLLHLKIAVVDVDGEKATATIDLGLDWVLPEKKSSK